MADKDNQEKIQKMQLLEQNIQNLLSQRQQFQQQLAEVESALAESKDTSQAYKIVGGIMIAVEKEKLQKELEERKERVSIRIKSLEKQEEQLKQKAKKMQEEVLEGLK